jgi:hypothetical protein
VKSNSCNWKLCVVGYIDIGCYLVDGMDLEQKPPLAKCCSQESLAPQFVASKCAEFYVLAFDM